MGLETLSEYGSSQRTGTGTSDRGKLTQWGTAEKKAKDSLHYPKFFVDKDFFHGQALF
jgi:hypothetical protein